ncbi:hypothetical protein TRV_00255 [Trichophyton verrucosum HKI 0517]|uniref:Kinetochore protein Sos7 coiled-coil domain-containing protein n=1 Tax=Trichophyton verrucosum (strain HKI 0517) TaxID=663202 RepID=D4CZL3_TRIVH|nr:uncharacterized protein TRV_00255 [Trichophyton verrucosum HKI 0517]EFE45004.1 hypothetical protein TRV_00255 [Trichophyton verrucosum HKI 0517]
MVDTVYSDALAQIQALDKEIPTDSLAIIRISEPIGTSDGNAASERSPSKRTSDVSTDAYDNPTPATLEADLTHYKELFSKLRFSYLEQVTKEKFLRAIVGDPPLVVAHSDNVELEAELAQIKEELQRRKEEVRISVEEMEKMSRDLAKTPYITGYENIQLQTTQLSELPASITNLEETVSRLRDAQSAQLQERSSLSPSQNLPLEATLRLLANKDAELTSLKRTLASSETALVRKTGEAEALERELAALEKKRNEVVAQAKEAQRRKLQGESDGLEEMGRWYAGAEQILKSLV